MTRGPKRDQRRCSLALSGIAERVRGGAWLRVAAGVALMLLLGGPTPGAVGACGSDELSGFADIQSYCSEREQLICVRRELRKELTHGERDDCRRAAIAACMARSWAPSCHPTERKARACLNALRSLDTVQTPEDQIDECRTSSLCMLHPNTQAPPLGDAGVEQ
jgi:hypothetical protein